ncbi:hypothetical protein [Leptospira meyeri]|uniref:hypothetical protein n=1 Tax=Leptospira meyeri TaxID=29508 RepID=UPI00223E3EAC|nr:hypothetical protein [Leptospira meyeri]MCW7490872.1 hypothetical protein [Leptospira meyeri]
MLKNKENFLGIQKDLINLKSENIEFKELGIGMDFSPAQELKNEICEYINTKIDEILSLKLEVPESFENLYYQSVNQAFQLLKNRITSIKNLIKEKQNNPQGFPQNRGNQLSSISSEKNSIKNLFHVHDIPLLTLKNNDKLSKLDIKKIGSEIEEQLNNIKDKEIEINKILNNITKGNINASIALSENKFKTLQTNHLFFEKVWLALSIVFTIVLSAFLLYVYFNFDPIFDFNFEIIFKLIKNGIIIVPLSFLIRLSIGKYNLERNLRIIYQHRMLIFEQYKYFENGLMDDPETRSKFLLNLSQLLFSDPQTGYINDSNNDINFNPIISIAEKISKP